MGKRRSRKVDPIDILPQIVGLALLGVLFVPGFKQAIGPLFLWVVIVGCVTVAGLIGWKLYKLASTTKEDWACLDKLDTNSGGFAGV